MKRIITIVLLILSFNISDAQVGIGNTDPKAQLDISAGSTPSEKDGILIPRLYEFPTGVTADQDGMLVFITDSVLQNRGFYYYDHQSLSWVEINPPSPAFSNSLDDAYNNGSSIIADQGNVMIGGVDGFRVSGGLGSGDQIANFLFESNLYFNPRKAAFRAGYIDGGPPAIFYWGEANVGLYSFAGGTTTRASGEASTAFGSFTNAAGNHSFAAGNYTEALSYGETVFGNFSNIYTATSITTFDPSDQLFSIGNGTSFTDQSNALTIYKSGLMNINDAYNMPLTDGTAGQLMATDGSGNVTFQNPNTGTDNQNLTTPILTGTTLNLGIENGTGTSINLKPLTEILKNPSYPDGFENASPMTYRFDAGSYTIPAGKNLYITSIYNNSPIADLTIDSKTIKIGVENLNAFQALEQPIIAGTGSVVANNCNTCSINGFLIDVQVTPITVNILSNYTVPINKILVILSVANGDSSFASINIDGVRVYSGLGNDTNITTAERQFAFKNPIFADEGNLLSSSSGISIINGYLIDK